MPYKRRRSGYKRVVKKARTGLYRRRRKIYKRRNYRRRRTNYGPIAKGNFGFGDRKVVKMRWYASYPVVIGSNGLVTGSRLRMNCVADPDGITGGNWGDKVPAGYRLYSRLYDRYTVIGSKAVYTLRQTRMVNPCPVNPTTSGTGGGSIRLSTMINPIVWGVKLDQDNSLNSMSAWYQVVSDRDVRHKTFAPGMLNNGFQRIVMKYSPRKFYGVKDPVGEESISADMGAVPARTATCIPWFQFQDLSASFSEVAEYLLQVNVYYTVVLTEPHDVYSLATDNALVEG